MANTHTTLTSLFTDIADAIREKTGSTEQIVADTFPTRISGIVSTGEDLYSTATDQTTAVTELMKMVNRKIAMNNGEGQYVWRKCTSQTISMTQQNAGANPTTFKMESNSVDLSKVDVSYFVGLTGKYTLPDSSVASAFTIKADGLYMGSSLRGALTYNASTQILSCAGSIGSLCTWLFDGQEPVFLDYVVSDGAEDYPNGGTQDGYWYELVQEGIDLSKFGITQFEEFEFTVSSRTKCQDRPITHSLGVPPRMLLIRADTDKSLSSFSSNDFTFMSAITLERTASYTVFGLRGYVSSGAETTTTGTVSMVADKVSISGTTYFKAGVTYRGFVGV